MMNQLTSNGDTFQIIVEDGLKQIDKQVNQKIHYINSNTLKCDLRKNDKCYFKIITLVKK